MSSISMRGLKKTYPNGVTAVRDFNLEVEDQEFIIFVGPSGCGKSTTLRMVAGLEEITDGDLLIDGERMNDIAPKDRDIAMVFQNYALYPHMTVYDNMAFALKLRHMTKSEIDEKVHAAARILEIEHLLDRKPKALSGGQRQRVAMGRAIVRNPKVFLMDEPLSNLDAKLRVQMRVEIAHLHERLKATIIYVTHDQVEAMTLGTRIVVMKDGVIQQVARPVDLYAAPENIFVAGFIGSPQMNFVDAEVVAEGKKTFLTFSDQKVLLPEDKAKKVADYVGKTVVMGIRPQDIHESEAALKEFKDSTINANVSICELLGATLNLYVTVGDNDMVAVVDPSLNAKAGSEVKLAIDNTKIHIFDRDTEATITN